LLVERGLNHKQAKMKAKIASVGVIIGSLLPTFAHAAYSTTTAAGDVNTAIADVGSTIGLTVPTILGLLAALIGLGWGVRKFVKWVSGKKF